MSYTPINWQTGDTITAEKLNKCDNGWSVESSTTQLCSESVTTADDGNGLYTGTLAYSTQITADSIVVTFNGTDYTVSKEVPFDGTTGYGTLSQSEPVFTTYPVYLLSCDDGTNLVYTETAGTYSVVISVPTETAETSDDFKLASQTALADILPLKINFGVTTWQEVLDAIEAGRIVYAIPSSASGVYIVVGVDDSLHTIVCTVNGGTLTYGTYDGTANGVIVES